MFLTSFFCLFSILFLGALLGFCGNFAEFVCKFCANSVQMWVKLRIFAVEFDLNDTIMTDIKTWMDKRRITERGWPIKFVVRYQNERFFISTGLYAEHDLVDGECSRTEKDYKAKNVLLARLKTRLYEEALKLEGRDLSAKAVQERLKECLNGKKTKGFLDYVTEFMEHITNEGTRRTYQTMYNKVEEYDGTVTLENIDVAWLQGFETEMKRRGYRPNYYGQLERSIRAVFNYCIDRGYTSSYPFRRFRTKSEKTIKRNLSAEELRTLRDYPCEEYQTVYRDMFMLMVYMIGINAVDLFNMPKIKGLRTGSYVTYKRTKIGSKASGIVKVRIEPEAMELIERYAGKEHMLCIIEEHCRNYQDFLHHMNKALQAIGLMERTGRGGKKVRTPLFPELTSYWARHTWATLAARSGASIDVIGKALGHADSRVADIYVEWDHKAIDKANRKVLDALKKGR